MTLILATAAPKISPEPSIDDIEFADTLVDPYTLLALRQAWPNVPFEAVDWAQLDACCGCPDTLMDPLPSQMVLHYRVGARKSHDPVGACCVTQELTWWTESVTRVRDLRVSVLRERTQATP